MKFSYLIVKRGTTIWLLIQLAFLIKARAAADFGTAAVLPQGRSQAVLRFGTVSDVQDKYNSAGALQSPGRLNQRLSNEYLKKLSPDFKKLVNRLDAQFPREKLGDQIDPGELNLKGKANVNYLAPQLAHGMTSRWTLGLAVPIINFQSNVHMENGGVNTTAAVLRQAGDVGRALSKDQADGLTHIKNGPKDLVASTLIKPEYDYKPISDRDTQFVGDVIVGSSFQIYNSRIYSLYLLNSLELPTGPKDDPDDLVDLTIFGKTQLTNTLFNNFDINYWWQLGLGLSYTYAIPDQITKRVPRYETDFIPPASTKENLDRDPGDTYSMQFASMFRVTDWLGMGVGYEIGYKGQDNYHGTKNGRYDLLNRDTFQQYQMAKFNMSYTTVTSYLNGASKIPYTVTYAVSDIVAGLNIERQLNQELLLKFYF